jgi:hypothetical protein
VKLHERLQGQLLRSRAPESAAYQLAARVYERRDEKSLAILVACLDERLPAHTVAAATRGLAHLGKSGRPFAHLIAPLIRSDDKRTALSAIQASMALENEAAIPILLAIVDDRSDDELVDYACMALKKITGDNSYDDKRTGRVHVFIVIKPFDEYYDHNHYSLVIPFSSREHP